MEKALNWVLGKFGVKLVRTRAMRDPCTLAVHKAAELGIETLFDIGANVGMFVETVRDMGYRKTAVSFEPTSEAHAQLVAKAARDPDWIAAPRMALGSSDGEARIGIAGNSVSSSLLPAEIGTTGVLPLTAFVGSETVAVRRLDSVIAPQWRGPYAMKIDTQGFELEVLRGATETLEQTRLLVIELTLGHLYSGGARVADVFAMLEAAGFRAIAVTEGFSDIARNEMLQVDAVFVRDE